MATTTPVAASAAASASAAAAARIFDAWTPTQLAAAISKSGRAPVWTELAKVARDNGIDGAIFGTYASSCGDVVALFREYGRRVSAPVARTLLRRLLEQVATVPLPGLTAQHGAIQSPVNADTISGARVPAPVPSLRLILSPNDSTQHNAAAPRRGKSLPGTLLPTTGNEGLQLPPPAMKIKGTARVGQTCTSNERCNGGRPEAATVAGEESDDEGFGSDVAEDDHDLAAALQGTLAWESSTLQWVWSGTWHGKDELAVAGHGANTFRYERACETIQSSMPGVASASGTFRGSFFLNMPSVQSVAGSASTSNGTSIHGSAGPAAGTSAKSTTSTPTTTNTTPSRRRATARVAQVPVEEQRVQLKFSSQGCGRLHVRGKGSNKIGSFVLRGAGTVTGTTATVRARKYYVKETVAVPLFQAAPYCANDSKARFEELLSLKARQDVVYLGQRYSVRWKTGDGNDVWYPGVFSSSWIDKRTLWVDSHGVARRGQVLFQIKYDDGDTEHSKVRVGHEVPAAAASIAAGSCRRCHVVVVHALC